MQRILEEAARLTPRIIELVLAGIRLSGQSRTQRFATMRRETLRPGDHVMPMWKLTQTRKHAITILRHKVAVAQL